MEYSSKSNVFVTVDSKAVRMWSACKQMRAAHIDADFKFVKLDYLEYCDSFLLLYYKPTLKKIVAELWSPLLDKIQQVVRFKSIPH